MKTIWDFRNDSIFFSKSLSFFFLLVSFGKRKVTLDWKVCLMIGMVNIIGEIGPGRIVRALRKIRVILQPGLKSASRDYFVALSRPHSCVPAVLDELEKLDTL